MPDHYTQEKLHGESIKYQGKHGTSEEVRSIGFIPAFLDVATGATYRSCYSDGRPAPCHLLDGLPSHLVEKRDRDGGVRAVRPSLISGFLRGKRFYTRDEAAKLASS